MAARLRSGPPQNPIRKKRGNEREFKGDEKEDDVEAGEEDKQGRLEQ